MNFAVTAGIVATLTQALTAPLPVAVPAGGADDRQFSLSAQAPDARNLPTPAIPQPETPVPAPPGARLESRVICGMTVVPVTPSADPGMVRTVPSDTWYHIRSIPPSLCAN